MSDRFPPRRLDVAILAARLRLYIKEKYGTRLDGAEWSTRTWQRFVRGEALIFLRDRGETADHLDLAVMDAVQLLTGEPEEPWHHHVHVGDPEHLADVIDLDEWRRDTRR